jgi:cytochrome oxidase Cu insertion factor (SCO1/SenC/PrrC family)|tara:strand:- start:1365 stop:1985 length:621 start_codon:yes stop_codon:yes gene_type:complete
MRRSAPYIIAVVALVLGLGGSWFAQNSKPIKLEVGRWFGEQARTLVDFELRDQNNQPFGEKQLKGKWSLLFFGYTHCPDICPISLQAMAEMMKAIDDKHVREDLQVAFISVDPARDTPALLKSYVEYFNPSFIGATAVLPELKKLTASIGIAHKLEKKSDDQESYLVSHSGAIVLLNPQAEFSGLFSAPHDALAMARDMTKIIEHY